ncbi:hypothetical protein VUR80DRAFT_1920 [Thermomyces stellatus]
MGYIDAELPHFGDGPARSTKSAETLALARRWITSCTADHQRCNSSTTGKGPYPTRLLDCGTADGGETCRLVETSTTAINGPYMTLSHCWGQADCLKLTTENYCQFLDEIPLPLLPQLYQDAVYITRSLGVRYLWVDALCIIQRGDKSRDWQHEVTLMHKVYSNSFCNISPTVAPDSNHSMFAVRDPDLVYPQSVNVSVNGTTTSHTVLNANFWNTEVSRSRLNKRAWVLQERLLSPRVLHFGRRQVLWECQEKDACELYPDGVPTGIFQSNSLPKNLTSGHDAATEETGDVAVAKYRSWTQIVRAYSACDLTFPGDKLVALSGVAKTMAKILRDEYVAGMWRRYLERDILWSVSWCRVKNTTGSMAYRAPSWSWASVDAEVNPGVLDVDATDVLIEVQHVELDYATNDTTGLLRGGWLRLRGVLKQLDLQHYPSSPAAGYKDWSMFVNGVHVSVPSDSKKGEPQPHIIPDAPPEDFNKEIADGELYGMPGRVRKGDEGTIYVLILRLVDRERGIFRRIGLAHGYGRDVKEKILARTPEEEVFPCEEYAGGLHSIRII